MKAFVTLVLLMIALLASGQNKTVFIKDSATHEPVPFAAIQFTDQSGGFYADEEGKAMLPDSICRVLVSQIAYHARKVDIDQASNPVVILLTPAHNQLAEVVVSNVSSKRKKVGMLKPKGSFGVIPTPNVNFALFIPYDPAWKQLPVITSIIAYLDNIKGNDTYSVVKSKIRFDLRLPDIEGRPSNVSLLGERIVYPTEKRYLGHEAVVLLHPVPFPPEGVFIVIDFILPSQLPVDRHCMISPTISCTGAFPLEQTWSRTLTNDFTWRKMDRHDPAWASTIRKVYGENSVMNLRAGLEIAY